MDPEVHPQPNKNIMRDQSKTETQQPRAGWSTTVKMALLAGGVPCLTARPQGTGRGSKLPALSTNYLVNIGTSSLFFFTQIFVIRFVPVLE